MTVTAKVDDDLVVDFDVHDPALADSADAFQDRVAELRHKGPVLYSSAISGFWIVTRYEDACTVLRDTETFSSYPNDLANSTQGKMPPIELDPPEHTAYRKALLPLFSPKRMQELEPQMRAVINDLIDDFSEDGECEFITAFAHELPARVFLALMGWPMEDAALFSETTDIALKGAPGKSPEESATLRAEAAFKIFGYFGDVVTRVNSGDYDMKSLTAQIITTPVDLPDGRRQLRIEEICQMFFLLAVAGLHTTQGSLAWSVINLADNPDQRAKLIEDPSQLPRAIEEVLRFEAAVSVGRRATCDTELAGVRIAAGDQLLVLLSSANRDEAKFDDPAHLHTDRAINHHLGFGMGAHRCIGSHLARLELRLALEEIHKRIPDYRLVEGKPPVMTGTQIRSCDALSIEFTPTPKLTRSES